MIYFFMDERDTVYFVLAYAKSAQEDLTAAQKRSLLELMRGFVDETWPKRGPGR